MNNNILYFKKESDSKTFYFLNFPILRFKIDANDKIFSKNNFYNVLLSLLCCFIPYKKNRKKIKLLNAFIPKTINYRSSKKAVEPYAFIRAKNEIGTIDACLSSILPVIKKGVIGYNDCDDGTEKYILDFCKRNKGFIPYKHEGGLYSFDDKRLFQKDCDESKKYYYYSNKVLELIPKNEWLLKVDCDHVFVPEKLENLMYLPTDNNDVVILPRINLHYDGKQIYIDKNNPITLSKDFWMIYNKNIIFKPMIVKKYNVLVEHLKVSSRHIIYSELNNYHFPYIKKRRNNIDMNNFIELQKFIDDDLLNKYIKEKGLPILVDNNILKNISLEYISKIKI